MTGKVIRIERKNSRAGGVEEPSLSARGYALGDPAHSILKHRAENAVYVKTLDEAAELMLRGFSLRMSRSGKRASMISPASLLVVRM